MFNLKRKPKRVVIEDYYWNPHRPKRWTWLIALCGVVTVISLLAFTQAVIAEPINGSGEMQLSHNGKTSPAIQQQAALNIDVQGMSAAIELQQTFKNTSNHWVNGRYVFPLPENAAVHFMQMRIGERLISSQIKERAEAKKIYQAATAAGKKAALTEQHRPNVFSQNVANIGPHETITVTLKYSQPVAYDNDTFTLRFPMTMTPRYMPGTKLSDTTQLLNAWSANTSEVSDASAISPWYTAPDNANTSNQIAININLNAGLPLAKISSPYHRLTVNKQAHGHHVSTAKPTVAMNRDFVLAWQATAEAAPSAASFSETIDSEHYVKVMVLPPISAEAKQTIPREVLFILDTSGSMGGPSIQQAKQSLLLALNRLKPHDFFNVYEFNSNYSQLFSRSHAATAHNINSAKRFVQKLQAGGGTHIAPPLLAALQSTSSENPVRQVVFITDGSVGNEAALFQLINQNLKDARLFTVGIGSAPNSYFMRKAAEFGRGTFTHIGSVNEVQQQMATLFNKLESPVLSGISLHWPNGIKADVWPEKIPDLYSGEPMVIYAKLNNAANQRLVVSGLAADKTWQKRLNIGAGSSQTNSGIIAQGWARAKIESLLDTKITGTPEAEVRKKVLAVALKHHLMSPYTSLVAVEDVISRPATQTAANAAVPLTKPLGQNVDSFQYPNTATNGPLHLAVALLGLLLLLVTRRGRYETA